MEKLIATKLPSKYFTAHEGFRLLGDSYILSARIAKGPEWERLVDRARKVPNLSDRVFLLASFAEMMSGKLIGVQKLLLVECLDLCDRIPVAYDRGERALFIAEIAKPIDKSLFRSAVSCILGKRSYKDIDDRNVDLKKRAVDMVYAEDEKWANELVSALDDEPTRDVRETLQKRIETLAKQARIAKRELDGLDLKGAPKFKSLAPLFAAIEGRRIDELYPILCFGVQSCVVNYENTEEAFGIMLRIFRVCLASSRLVVHCLGEGKALGSSETDKLAISVLQIR